MTVAAYPIAVNHVTGDLEYASQPHPTASHQGLAGWAYDTASIQANSTGYTAGVLQLIRVSPDESKRVSKVVLSIATGGTTPANCFAGLYNSSGTRMSGSADQSGSWNSSGVKEVALTSAQDVVANNDYYVGLLVGSAVLLPALHLAVFSAAAMAGETAAPYRWMTSGSGFTALPASVTLGSGSQNALTFWAGLKV